jgi:cytochrome c peroxidase
VPRPFHDTGLDNVGGRAPSLRSVAVTAPCMHDGSIATLREVVATDAAGGRNITGGPEAGDGRLNLDKDDLISGISLTDRRFLRDPALSDPFSRR